MKDDVAMTEKEAQRIVQAFRVRCAAAIESRDWISPTMDEVTALSVLLCRPAEDGLAREPVAWMCAEHKQLPCVVTNIGKQDKVSEGWAAHFNIPLYRSPPL